MTFSLPLPSSFLKFPNQSNVTSNSPSQDYTHPDDPSLLSSDASEFYVRKDIHDSSRNPYEDIKFRGLCAVVYVCVLFS